MWGFHEGMGWWMVFGGIWMVVFWAMVVGAVVWAVGRRTAQGKSSSGRGESAIDIAKRRLAIGEISVDEYSRLISVIQ